MAQLCEGTFLSLWSYPRLYRDQRAGAHAEGKEVADLIVVFENDVIIFSDKHCGVPSSGDIRKDWNRWFRRAVQKSADQTWGAERWIRNVPDRLFLDKECKKLFPFPLPDVSQARFHLVVVAHDIAQHCARVLGGSGSLIIRNDLKGVAAHVEPFAVGDLDPSRTFVHVLDDTSLNIVIQTLDTIGDFTSYLEKKEKLLRSGQAIFAVGEEELLALYLTRIGPDGEHDFAFPSDATGITVGEGYWERFQADPQRRAQVEANRVSYVWDRLIETFNRHALHGSQYYVSPGGIQSTERIMRFMAREPRLRRRMLGAALGGLLRRTAPDLRASRVMLPSRPGDPFYVFLLLPPPKDRSYEEYRAARVTLLEMYCRVAKVQFPEAQDIVGIATEPGFGAVRSEDAIYMDARVWSEEHESEAKKLQEEMKILVNTVERRYTAKEYPDMETVNPAPPQMPTQRNPRNKPCPCGSGKKYKKCHGQ
ncbi:MAG: SEC-C domain-containing protein [Candidatus Methylomirabilales bacterium]